MSRGFQFCNLHYLNINDGNDVTLPHITLSNKYTVMAGTPEKMVEYILDSCVDCREDVESG